MPESFGARLRLRREEQGIALSAIAEELKIKLSLLEAVERDDVSHWPSGIYRRAFIRAYAHAIGLNPDVVVREFLELHPDPDEAIATASAIASVAENARTSAGPPTRLRNIVDSAIGSLSRLGRGSLIQDPVVAKWASVRAAAAAEPASPAAPDPSPDRGAVERTNEVAAECTPVGVPAALGDVDEAAPMMTLQVKHPRSADPDFLAVAHLCTEFGRVRNANELKPLLQEAARILDAIGLIVWLWDATAEALRPALVYGYSDKVLAQLPAVSRDADNATAAAFRSARLCAIHGDDHNSAALVVPLVEPDGCAGVLAIELPDGREQTTSVHAVAMIFAAALTQLVGDSRTADVH